MQFAFFRSLLFLTPSLFLAGCTLSPETPPLLNGVTAGGGGWWNGGCPQSESAPAGMSEALSPELTARLKEAFPAGGSAINLENALRQQGFGKVTPCDEEPSVRTSIFRQTGGGFFGPYPIFAVVAWKQDEEGRILWTKGHVAFTGP